MIEEHQLYMKRALQLAEKGKFQVAPNPRVGCVIVHNQKIIGEGFHRKHGEAHAEVNAINSVIDKSKLKESTLYVTLEPCSHFGKTPPCANLIIENNIPKVVIAAMDPNQKVNGKGVQKLKENKIEVISGILEVDANFQNRRFNTFHQKKRPYILLKWAETKDGFISRKISDPNFEDNWITSKASKQLVHLWRAEEQAILVGKNTAKYDNPQLDCREVAGQNPIRIVFDSNLELSPKLELFNQKQETLIINHLKSAKDGLVEYIKTKPDTDPIEFLLEELHNRGIQSLIVEGGRETLNSFINANYWDEARRFIGNKNFTDGILAPSFENKPSIEKQIEEDTLLIYYNK